ncbi:globin-3-like isoform X2 [Tachypleus tridentatus]|uniref:globin-3-like isoform X2 n=1 Tax=Tachypleus tridentatus TaxID=6853 RepID=UPI003FD66ABA
MTHVAGDFTYVILKKKRLLLKVNFFFCYCSNNIEYLVQVRTSSCGSIEKMKRNGLLDQYSCTVSCQVSDPPERPILKRNQIAILTNTSKLLVENISRVGVITFMNLFEAHPDVQEVFMPFKGLSGNDLRYSRELRAHAFRVMGIVQKVITRLNEEEKLDQLLTDLGKKHARYGAKPKYIDVPSSCTPSNHRWKIIGRKKWKKPGVSYFVI